MTSALPQPILALLAEGFPGQPITLLGKTTGGFSHHTSVVAISGAEYIIKAANAPLKRADVRHEAEVLRLLQGHELPVPRLVTLLEDESWTVEVVNRIEGQPGIYLYEKPYAELGLAFRQLGKLLAETHLTPSVALALELLVTRTRETDAALQQLPLDDELQTHLQASLNHSVWSEGDTHLVHGDAGLHNILWTSHITALLDWEWASCGTPLSDLAWLQWTMHFRGIPHMWEIFRAGYGPLPQGDASPEALRALVLGHMAHILTRIHQQTPVYQEWQRRICWTLTLDFSL